MKMFRLKSLVIATVTAMGLAIFSEVSHAIPTAGFTFQIVGEAGNLNPPNVPIMTLTNDSLAARITSFSITIGRPDRHFATIAGIYNETNVIDPGIDLMFTPPNDPAPQTARLGVLAYTFSGFDSGDVFSFQADLDGNPAQNIVLDFQDTFFNNGAATPNSVLTAVFSNGQELFLTLPENPSPFSGDGSTNDPFAYSFTVIPETGVPEPITAILGMMGLGVLGYTTKRQRVV